MFNYKVIIHFLHFLIFIMYYFNLSHKKQVLKYLIILQMRKTCEHYELSQQYSYFYSFLFCLLFSVFKFFIQAQFKWWISQASLFLGFCQVIQTILFFLFPTKVENQHYSFFSLVCCFLYNVQVISFLKKGGGQIFKTRTYGSK